MTKFSKRRLTLKYSRTEVEDNKVSKQYLGTKKKRKTERKKLMMHKQVLKQNRP